LAPRSFSVRGHCARPLCRCDAARRRDRRSIEPLNILDLLPVRPRLLQSDRVAHSLINIRRRARRHRPPALIDLSLPNRTRSYFRYQTALPRDVTVEQLEAAFAAKRKAEIDSLRDKRAELLEQLKAVDKRLEAAGVGVPGAR
jgi:hypothetical protein